MSGEQMQQDRIRDDSARQNAQRGRVTIDEIVALYAPHINALSNPRRPMSSPD